MKNFLNNFRMKMQQYMAYRYGNDELNRFLTIVSLIFFVISFIRPLRILFYVALAFLIWSYLRMFSKNIYKRQNELGKYLDMKKKALQEWKLVRCMWRDRKTHRYSHCPNCKAVVRVAKQNPRRQVTVTCPRCHQHFQKKV